MAIKEDADVIRARIRELQGEIKVEQARLGVVRARCAHPDKFRRSTMGDVGWHCPDCGWGT